MNAQLTPDQEAALSEILGGYAPAARHLLIGDAGSGKTFLMAQVAKKFLSRGKSVICAAPTHKAVSVMAAKMAAAGVPVQCLTIHSLLSLKPKVVADRQVFERKSRADPVMEDVVIIDECSMLGSDLMRHIKRYLPNSFVLFVGDRAQLPPVGETESQSFGTFVKSRLRTIVRQGAGNPILDAASILRESQAAGQMNWSWVKAAKSDAGGIYMPSDPEAWMKRAFTSKEFEADPDSFRYLAWRNDRVARINTMVRRWRYGENLSTPFMPGERIMLRKPLLRGDMIVFNTNDEVDLLEINRSTKQFAFSAGANGMQAWEVNIPTWEMKLRYPGSDDVEVAHMPSDEREWNRAESRLRDEAADHRDRWGEMHRMRAAVVKCQSVYALTCHNSQGSTFGRVFLDLPDIAPRAESNLLECQQMLYVAVTRPSIAAMVLT